MIGSHLIQVWYSEVGGCKMVQHVFRKGKGVLQTKSTNKKYELFGQIWACEFDL